MQVLNLDLEAARNKNIKVMRVPAYSPQAVAEHSVALILTLNRKTHKVYNRVRESNFLRENLIGFNFYGKTVGVIGTGKIGAAFCQIMLGFGCKVIAYDVYECEKHKEKGVEYKSLNELFINSDIISLHYPLNENTKYLFDSAAFSKIKNGAMLINTSRGALIKTSDAIDALKKFTDFEEGLPLENELKL